MYVRTYIHTSVHSHLKVGVLFQLLHHNGDTNCKYGQIHHQSLSGPHAHLQTMQYVPYNAQQYDWETTLTHSWCDHKDPRHAHLNDTSDSSFLYTVKWQWHRIEYKMPNPTRPTYTLYPFHLISKRKQREVEEAASLHTLHTSQRRQTTQFSPSQQHQAVSVSEEELVQPACGVMPVTATICVTTPGQHSLTNQTPPVGQPFIQTPSACLVRINGWRMGEVGRWDYRPVGLPSTVLCMWH